MDATVEKLTPGRKPEPPQILGVKCEKEHMVAAIANKMGDAVSVFHVFVPGEKDEKEEWWVFDVFTFLGGSKRDIEMGLTTRVTLRIGGDIRDFANQLQAAANATS